MRARFVAPLLQRARSLANPPSLKYVDGVSRSFRSFFLEQAFCRHSTQGPPVRTGGCDPSLAIALCGKDPSLFTEIAGRTSHTSPYDSRRRRCTALRATPEGASARLLSKSFPLNTSWCGETSSGRVNPIRVLNMLGRRSSFLLV